MLPLLDLSRIMLVRVKIIQIFQETECPVCVDVRSSVIQFTAGFIFPLFFSYTGAAIAATANNAR